MGLSNGFWDVFGWLPSRLDGYQDMAVTGAMAARSKFRDDGTRLLPLVRFISPETGGEILLNPPPPPYDVLSVVL